MSSKAGKPSSRAVQCTFVMFAVQFSIDVVCAPMYWLCIIVHITLSICIISFVECVLTMVLTLIHFVILAGMHGSPSPVVL